jgi:hypothetical protein
MVFTTILFIIDFICPLSDQETNVYGVRGPKHIYHNWSMNKIDLTVVCENLWTITL